MSILGQLCADVLAAIPLDQSTLRSSVSDVKTSVDFLLLPEMEATWWRKLAVCLRDVRPPGEWQERVIQLFNDASAHRDAEVRAERDQS